MARGIKINEIINTAFVELDYKKISIAISREIRVARVRRRSRPFVENCTLFITTFAILIAYNVDII